MADEQSVWNKDTRTMPDKIFFGDAPVALGRFPFDLREVMYYLYLPVVLHDDLEIRLPPNVEVCRPMIQYCMADALGLFGRRKKQHSFRYVYLSARKGWATPDNPLNRPGWHSDGFGTDDLNYLWWTGPGTRFAIQRFENISDDHLVSLQQFEAQVRDECVLSDFREKQCYAVHPGVVHATPLIEAPGCMRQYVKVSLSNRRYNLENNSHNYLFDYDWPLHPRAEMRNDTQKAQLDYNDDEKDTP